MTSFRLQNAYQNEPQNGTRNWTPQKAAFLRKKNPVFQKGDQNGTPKRATVWGARLFYVASLFFTRFWGLPNLLWTIICPHFRALGLDFLVFSRLRFQDFGANETHPIHTHKPTIFIFHKGCPLRAGGDARSVRIRKSIFVTGFSADPIGVDPISRPLSNILVQHSLTLLSIVLILSVFSTSWQVCVHRKNLDFGTRCFSPRCET